MNTENKQTLELPKDVVSKSAFLDSFSEHIYFQNPKLISMLTALENHIEKLLALFPEGQLVIVADGVVVGSALSILVTEDFAFKTNEPRD